jgi:rhodanese-related sulfurtransferase
MARMQSENSVPGVGPTRAAQLVAGGALLVDVREAHEWDAGHPPAAVHVPVGAVVDELVNLPRDRQIIIVCRSGRRSAAVTDQLLQSGFDAVNLDGGAMAWVESGLPFETDDGGPGTVA